MGSYRKTVRSVRSVRTLGMQCSELLGATERHIFFCSSRDRAVQPIREMCLFTATTNRQEAKGKTTMRSTGDPTFDLVAATYRQAIADAKRGDPEAIQWLDVCCPDWRRMEKRPKIHPSPRSLRSKKSGSAHVIKNAQNRQLSTPKIA